jgi:cell division septum initiation protein DivIVA
VAGCLFVLATGTAWAADKPPPNPEKLWEAFPLDPQATTPSLQPPAAEPAEPAPPPRSPVTEGEPETGWSPLVLGGLAGAVLLLVSAAFLLTTVKRRRAVAPQHAEAADELIARAYVLAAECDMLLASQRDKGVESVSETADHDVPAAQATPTGSGSGSYAEIGERVAGVLSAAEAAAEQIRADARLNGEDLLRAAKEDADQVRNEAMAYDGDTRAAVSAYASDRRREAEQQAQQQLADAEAQARATREAAEEMARQIEEDGRQRGQALREESRAVEERLIKVLVGLRRMTVQLEELVGTPAAAAQTDGESLADALRPYAQRDEELQPLIEDR